jgi:hypothetical protein
VVALTAECGCQVRDQGGPHGCHFNRLRPLGQERGHLLAEGYSDSSLIPHVGIHAQDRTMAGDRAPYARAD